MFCTCTSMGLLGINAYKVAVEVDLSESFPGFDIVGLPDVAVKESRDRVRTAIINSGFDFPIGKIVVNLAPSDIKKAVIIHPAADISEISVARFITY